MIMWALAFKKCAYLLQLRHLKKSYHIVVIFPSKIQTLRFLKTLEINDVEVSIVSIDIFYLSGLLRVFQMDQSYPLELGACFDLRNNSKDLMS